ncbi:MAG: GNAT family N-acetyltransferase, partial [Clostridia bacterium]|nr:GNAT family N-acetyltransferase [Clostridia bacterium]
MKQYAILLNGPSSSGKTTLSKALRKLIEEKRFGTYQIVSIDDFMKTDPNETIYEEDVFEISGEMCGKAKEILSTGAGVIVDHVITSGRIYDEFRNILRGFPICTVRVDCPLEILRERELRRGDRCIGSAQASYEYLYPKEGYDLTVDTAGSSPRENAQKIFDYLFALNLELRKINRRDVLPQWEYTAALPADENGLTNPYCGVSFEEYKEKVLPFLISCEHPVGMPDWFVPETRYYLWDGDTLVGEFRIRHFLTEALRQGAGHIGYSIRKDLRARGYGTAGLKRTVELAKKIVPEDEIFLRVRKDNVASQKVILRCGAYVAREDETHLFMRIPKDGEKQMEKNREELQLALNDGEWSFTYTDHDRQIVRAVVTDGNGFFYFCRARRNDVFGKATVIETSGGGVEPGEDFDSAIRRELQEELGAQVEILCRIGTVSDYYNLIHRHNLNHYYLCRATSFGNTRMTEDEINIYHISTLKLTYEDALAEYEKCRDSKLGRLI